MKIKLDRSSRLGSGGSGLVFRGTFNDRSVAVKKVDMIKQYIARYIEGNDNEGNVLLSLDHPNVIKLFHIEADENFE